MIESRKYQRYDKEIKVEYSISDSDIINSVAGKILNISLGGVYIITDLLVEKNLKLDLKFSFVKDDELIILKTIGAVLRSGDRNSDLDINKKYHFFSDDGMYFAAIKFFEPFVELSLLSQE
ncbi:MAG: PilZ domain-containing protein [Spirochaetes bacterium]|nr:PilZ domain-containing protein [Spirochaetota bacterium]